MRFLLDLRAAAAEKPATTCRDVLEAYLTRHAERKCKARTRAAYRDIVDRILVPEIGDTPADALTPSDVDRLLEMFDDRPALGNKVFAVLRASFDKAVRWGMRASYLSNPATGAEPFPAPERDTYLEPDEMLAVLAAARAVGQRPGRWWAGRCIELLAITGCRRDEWRCAQVGWVDVEAGRITWPDTKTGRGQLDLSGAALDLVRELTSHEAQRDGRGWLFRGENAAICLPRGTFYRAWVEVVEEAVALGVDRRRLEGQRLHDLRHAYGSLALSSGLSLDDVAVLLRNRDRRSSVVGKVRPTPPQPIARTGGRVHRLPRDPGLIHAMRT